MKKLLIIYILFFAMTLIIPAAVCFTDKSPSNSNELQTIFHDEIKQTEK